jgi:hypothetical protein
MYAVMAFGPFSPGAGPFRGLPVLMGGFEAASGSELMMVLP